VSVKRLLLCVAAIALCASGCVWDQAGHDQTRGGWNNLEQTITPASGALVKAWAASVPGQPDEALVHDGTVYVRSGDTVSAFSLATGDNTWAHVSLPGRGTPVFQNGVIYVPVDATLSTPCSVYSLDAATGRIIDHLDLPTMLTEFGTTNSCVAGDALLTGGTLVVPWFAVQEGVAPHCGGFVAAGAGDSAIDLAHSSITWTAFTPSPDNERCFPGVFPVDVPFAGDSSFTRVGNFVVTTNGTHVIAYALSDCGNTGSGCVPAWNTDVGANVIGPAVATVGGTVTIATTTGNIAVLDAATGATKWTDAVGHTVAVPVAATSTSVFVGTTDALIAAFPVGGCGSSTCAPSWTAHTEGGGSAGARLSIGGDVVYLGDNFNYVSAFDANGCGGSTCSPLFFVAPQEPTGAPPTIADGHVIVGTVHGNIFAYTAPPSSP
jgi:PQQ-like domain